MGRPHRPNTVKILTAVVVFVLAVAGCATSQDESETIVGPHATAVQFAVDRGHSEDNDLVFVVEPDPGMWDQWCTGEGDFVPCHALQAMTIDLGAPFPSDVRNEIEGALAPRDVEFVDDRSTVVLPPAVYPPLIKDGGALLSFGRAIEADGKIYLPVDGIGEGWLLELTPAANGWALDVVVTWIA